MKKIIKPLVIIVVLSLAGIAAGIVLHYLNSKTTPLYLANDEEMVTVFDQDHNYIKLPRGLLLDVKEKPKKIDEELYYQFVYDNQKYYVSAEYLVEDIKECVKEKQLYVLKNHILSVEPDDFHIAGWVKKESLVNIDGFNKLLADGSVDYYYVNNCGYLAKEYLSKQYYDSSLDGSIYQDCYFGQGGDPTLIDYYPKDTLDFKDNKMPEVVKALYINAEAVEAVDNYLEIAKGSAINSFVVDIKDCYLDTQLAYQSEVGQKYAPSTENIVNSFESYRQNVKKIKDAGYYLIGRITAFKDDSFAIDNPEQALEYEGRLYNYGSVKWPSIYSRKMWEYNVALAYEAVLEMGFDEIQFDYVRLPEDVEDVNLKNTYDEERCQAICDFIRYACEYLHKINAYVSVDVFGESSGDSADYFSCFSTYYGQFFPAISNAADAISSMPYPDHFSDYSFGVSEPWSHPYELMLGWSKATYYAQENTYDPAKCRTWIMAQDSDPYDIYYGPDFIQGQITALKQSDVFDGFMTWNAASSLSKYALYIDVLD